MCSFNYICDKLNTNFHKKLRIIVKKKLNLILMQIAAMQRILLKGIDQYDLSPNTNLIKSSTIKDGEDSNNQLQQQISNIRGQQRETYFKDTNTNLINLNNLPYNSIHQNTVTLDQYRLHLYNYALNIERLRCPQYGTPTNSIISSYAPGSSVALSMSLFPQRIFQPEEPKPQYSYIGLIAMAILSSTEAKLVLSDIYQYILDNYPYFRTRGPGWRNSIRHNLSLNDCFIKSGRSANGKGHYWAIHPANLDDFRKGDFRRRKAQRKVRKHMGLSVDDINTDSPSPPPLDLTTPPPPPTYQIGNTHNFSHHHHHHRYPTTYFHEHNLITGRSFTNATATNSIPSYIMKTQPFFNVPNQQNFAQSSGCFNESKEISTTTTNTIANLYAHTKKRQFDVASLLAPDVKVDFNESLKNAATTGITTQHTLISKVSVKHQETFITATQNDNKIISTKTPIEIDDQEDIDVEASDIEENGNKHDEDDNDFFENSTRPISITETVNQYNLSQDNSTTPEAATLASGFNFLTKQDLRENSIQSKFRNNKQREDLKHQKSSRLHTLNGLRNLDAQIVEHYYMSSTFRNKNN